MAFSISLNWILALYPCFSTLLAQGNSLQLNQEETIQEGVDLGIQQKMTETCQDGL